MVVDGAKQLRAGAALPAWHSSPDPRLTPGLAEAGVKLLLQTPLSCSPISWAGAAPCQPRQHQPPALVWSGIHLAEGWEHRCCSRSGCSPPPPPLLTAPICHHRAWHQGAGQGVWISQHRPCDRCLAYASSACSARGGRQSAPAMAGSAAAHRGRFYQGDSAGGWSRVWWVYV